MSQETNTVWSAVIATEDEHGEGAEDFARSEAARAAATGDTEREGSWRMVADELHILHAINRRRARPRGDAPPAARP